MLYHAALSPEWVLHSFPCFPSEGKDGMVLFLSVICRSLDLPGLGTTGHSLHLQA